MTPNFEVLLIRPPPQTEKPILDCQNQRRSCAAKSAKRNQKKKEKKRKKKQDKKHSKP
jgi:hypothetical protein